eukprot:TRINITY_DN1296_c0_g2_i4.p4 TRINITY_DN1296_c0_g2~~TRINITY_DN1296_c0_g2_i4.p4  ORF type:complete len:104 (+),score=10.99 TRINITY_DN1296_c0_g2_i4:348-659(+)
MSNNSKDQESQAALLLNKQLKELLRNPVDGFSAGLKDDSNIYEWQVTIMGPPDTYYEGGFFNAMLKFPRNYPNSPPECRFISEMMTIPAAEVPTLHGANMGGG